MSTELVIPTADQVSIGNAFGFTPAEVAVVQNSVAKGTNKIELAYFLNVCKTMDMNPFNKEVWCYKDNRDNLLIFAGRDGFLSKAQKNPLFNGIRSCEVREKDEWSIDVANNDIKHKITKPLKERGNIIGAYAIIFRKGGEPTIEWSDFDTYNKGWNTWKTHPAEMIKKVSESHALKKAFGISGIQSEYEFDIKDNKAIPNNTKTQKEIISDKAYDRVTDHINSANDMATLLQVKDKLKDDAHKKIYLEKIKELTV
jgi:phage recombination protein Bet